MIAELKKLLKEKKYKMFSKNIDSIEYNYIIIGDRIYFISIVDSIDQCELQECSNEIAINISRIIKNDKYKEFFKNDIKLSGKDEEIIGKNLDLRAFLWDLYIINIVISDKKKFFPNEVVSRIQRERLIARRIIIQEETLEDVVKKLIEEFSPTEKLDNIIKRYDENTKESNIIEKLLDKNLKENREDIISKKNLVLEGHINEISKCAESNINIDDIEKYLDNIKTTYEQLKEYLKK